MEGSAAWRLEPSITTGGNTHVGRDLSIYQSHFWPSSLLTTRMQIQGLIRQRQLSKEAAARPCAHHFGMCLPWWDSYSRIQADWKRLWA